MKIERLEIRTSLLLTPARHGDPRGFFPRRFARMPCAERRSCGIRAGQSRFLRPKGRAARVAFPDAAPRAGQARAVPRGAILDVGVDIRGLADLWPPCCGRTVGSKLASLGAARFCPWLRDAGGRLRGYLQGH